MSPGRLTVVFLTPAGALAGHAVGYTVAGGHAHSGLGHGYLTAVTAVTVPLALAALAWQGYQGATRGRRPSLAPLLVAQPLLFLVQEGIEHLLAGHGLASLAGSPAVGAGVVAQVVVVGLTLLCVRAARATGRAVAAALRRGGDGWCRRPPVLRPPAVESAVSVAPVSPVRERGPPPLSFLA